MNRLFREAVLAGLLFPCLLFAQKTENKWNAQGNLFLYEYSQWENSSVSGRKSTDPVRTLLQQRYGLCRLATSLKSGSDYLPVILMYREESALRQAENLGFKTQTRLDGICTGFLPLHRSSEIARIDGILHISANIPKKLDNDQSRIKSSVDDVQHGFALSGLDSAYTGKGVIIGIIDVGFDYTHPAFFTETADSATYRIKRVWDQNMEGAHHPDTFSYGVEYTSFREILAIGQDKYSQEKTAHHGTYVASIAAGSGAGTPYKGMAPEADLVLVSSTLTDAAIIDAVAYIWNYARKEGKPCVVNLSMGSDLGPHDGTSVTDKALNRFVSQGAVLVGSAGNSGHDTIHLSGRVAVGDSLQTGLVLSADGEPSCMDVYDMAGGLSVKVRLYDTSRKELYVNENGENSEAFYAMASDIKQEQVLCYGPDTVLVVRGALGSHDVYLESNVFLQFEYKKNVAVNCVPVVCFRPLRDGDSTRFHAWLEKGFFTDFGLENLVSGDCMYTHNGNISSADSVISVGAYTSKTNWKTTDGHVYAYQNAVEEDDICAFSGKGPRMDEVIKPDIAAPGSAIVSAANSFCNVPSNAQVAKSEYNGKDYPWAVTQGTSMSSPAVSGIIALFLQRDPALTYGKIKRLLNGTARKDAPVVSGGENVWGCGKIDALAALVAIENGYDYNDYYVSARGEDGFRLKTALKSIIGKDSVLPPCGGFYLSAFPQNWFSGYERPSTDRHQFFESDSLTVLMRRDYPLGETGTKFWQSDYGALGLCVTPGYNDTVFEPADAYKGDFARMYLYMVTRYADSLRSWRTAVLDGSSDYGFGKWELDLMLKWHRADKVDAREKERNDTVYRYQGNRNPFVDEPYWAEVVFGIPKAVIKITGAGLIISEYVCGTYKGFPQRAVEIYNGTDTAVDMGRYSLRFEKDGTGGFSRQLPLTGKLRPHACFVVADSQSKDGKLLYADMFADLGFDGNDAIGLYAGEHLVDVVGVRGSGEYWGRDRILRRKGINRPFTAFTEDQWMVYNANLTGDIGGYWGGDFNPSALISVAVNKGLDSLILTYSKPLEVEDIASDAVFVTKKDSGNRIFPRQVSVAGNSLQVILSAALKNATGYLLHIPSFYDRWKLSTDSCLYGFETEKGEDPLPETPKYTVLIAQTEGGVVYAGFNGTALVSGAKLDSASVISLTAIANTDYEFKRWWNGYTGPGFTYTLDSNVRVSAVFERKPPVQDPDTVRYVFEILPCEGGTVEAYLNGEKLQTPSLVDSASTVRLKAVADSGYLFKRWWTGDTVSEISYTVLGAVSVTAVFETKPGDTIIPEDPRRDTTRYIVTVIQCEDCGGSRIEVSLNGMPVTSGQAVDSGSVLGLKALPAGGYEFEAWWNGETALETHHVLEAPVEIRGQFKKKEDTVVVSDTRNITVEVEFWPNPSAGVFHVKIPYALHGMLYNEEGRLIKSFEWREAGVKELDLSGYCAGLYYLRLTDGNKKKVLKLVIQ